MIYLLRKDTAALFFEDCRLPASALLGEENKGFFYLMNELPQERLTIGIHACAHAEYMFELTREYVMTRKAYGKSLANLQVCPIQRAAGSSSSVTISFYENRPFSTSWRI